MNKKQLENVIRYAKPISAADSVKLLAIPSVGIAGQDLYSMPLSSVITEDQKAALDGANSPSATNVVLTTSDIVTSILTADEKAAINGADTPSATNIFITESNSLKVYFGTEITDDFTLTTAEANKYVDVNKATAVTVTVPKDTFSEGDVIILEQKGAGQVTVAPVDGDVTLTGGLKTFDQYYIIQLVFKSANVVNIIGGTNV